MTKRLPLMIEDPSEPQHVRELLEAGRSFNVPDYDFDQGLAKHLGAVQAGAPMPKWAESLQSSGGGAPAAGIAGATLAGWVVLPIITAVVVTTVWLSSGSAPAPQVQGAGSQMAPTSPAANSVTAVAPSPAPVADEPANAVEPAGAHDRAERATSRREAAKSQPARAGKRAAAQAAAKGESQPALDFGGNGVGTGSNTASHPSGPASGEGVGRAATAQPVKQQTATAAQPAQAEPAADEPEREVARAAEPVKPEPARLDDAQLEREMTMLAVAQRVLQSDPQRALNLARQGESEFAGSMFTQERQQLLLLALVKLGKLDEAKRLARPYLARYPKGPFSDRVRRALATGRVER